MFKDLMFFISHNNFLYVATLTFGCLLMLQSLSENSFHIFFSNTEILPEYSSVFGIFKYSNHVEE